MKTAFGMSNVLILIPDDVNEEIWSESSSVQESVQPLCDLRKLNAIGAQQGMIDPDPESDPPATCETLLPWVPDLLGKNWRAEDSILIVGSAYAGFIKEYSGNVGCISAITYGAMTRANSERSS